MEKIAIKKILASLICLYLLAPVWAQKFQGLALTPPMGWNSWNTFETHISDALVRQTADIMVSSGMRDAGYTYLVLDDGWMAMERDSITGDLVPDPKKFPNGMKALVDYVHAKGLKFGLYNCAGTKTCAGYPGTRGYEYQDARFYAALGIDYLKYDWCYADSLNAQEAYTTMSKALKKAGRPIVFSLCEWGTNKPWKWAEPVGQLWRTTFDISPVFDGYLDHGTWKQDGVLKLLDQQEGLRQYAGPDHWNDPDMLEVGNGLTDAENRAHFSLWCMLAAPLMAGNDLRNMTAETKAVLTNKDVIAVDQDVLGIQGFLYSKKDSLEIFLKPLSGDNWAICFLNRSHKPFPLQFNWDEHLITDTIFHKILDTKKTTYQVRDLWLKKNIGTTKTPITTILASHDVLMLTLRHN